MKCVYLNLQIKIINLASKTCIQPEEIYILFADHILVHTLKCEIGMIFKLPGIFEFHFSIPMQKNVIMKKAVHSLPLKYFFLKCYFLSYI